MSNAPMISANSHHELSVFLDFANAAAIPIDTSTVKTCNPPEPDIWCNCAGEAVYFELGRLLDPYMQERRKKALMNMNQLVSVNSRRARLPERDILQKKLSKSKYYLTGDVPLELLLYYDTEHAMVLGAIPPVDFESLASRVMEPMLTPMPSHIRRVWVFERYRNSVMWCHPRSQPMTTKRERPFDG